MLPQRATQLQLRKAAGAAFRDLYRMLEHFEVPCHPPSLVNVHKKYGALSHRRHVCCVLLRMCEHLHVRLALIWKRRDCLPTAGFFKVILSQIFAYPLLAQVEKLEGLESLEQQRLPHQQQRSRLGPLQEGTVITLQGSGIDLSPCWRHAGVLLACLLVSQCF